MKRHEFWKNGKMVSFTEREYTQPEQEGIAVGELRSLDDEISREKYHDLSKLSNSGLPEFYKANVYKKRLHAYKLNQIRQEIFIRDVLGVFPRYRDLPTEAKTGDIAYSSSLSGLLLTKPSGIYKYENDTWKLTKKIL